MCIRDRISGTAPNSRVGATMIGGPISGDTVQLRVHDGHLQKPRGRQRFELSTCMQARLAMEAQEVVQRGKPEQLGSGCTSRPTSPAHMPHSTTRGNVGSPVAR